MSMSHKVSVIDGLYRNGRIEFIHVRHEECGALAAVIGGHAIDLGRAVT